MNKKLRKFLKNKEGNISFFFAFVFIGIILLFLFAVANPLLINISSSFYQAGEDILEESGGVIDTISDASVRAELNGMVDAAQESTTDNIEVLTFFYQYGWIFVIVITCFVIFVIARKQVEVDII